MLSSARPRLTLSSGSIRQAFIGHLALLLGWLRSRRRMTRSSVAASGFADGAVDWCGRVVFLQLCASTCQAPPVDAGSLAAAASGGGPDPLPVTAAQGGEEQMHSSHALAFWPEFCLTLCHRCGRLVHHRGPEAPPEGVPWADSERRRKIVKDSEGTVPAARGYPEVGAARPRAARGSNGQLLAYF